MVELQQVYEGWWGRFERGGRVHDEAGVGVHVGMDGKEPGLDGHATALSHFAHISQTLLLALDRAPLVVVVVVVQKSR